MSAQNVVKKNKAPKPQDIQTAQAIIEQKALVEQARVNQLQAEAQHVAAVMQAQQDALTPPGQAPLQYAPVPDMSALMPAQAPPPQVATFSTPAPPPPAQYVAQQPPYPPQYAPQPQPQAPAYDPVQAENQALRHQLAMMQAQGRAQPPIQQQQAPPQFVNPMLKPARPAGPAGQVGPDGSFKELDILFAEGQFGAPKLPPNLQQHPQPMQYPPQAPPIQLNTPPQNIMSTPPGTRTEHNWQNNPYLAQQFPEVVDIFQGRIPGAAPIHGVPQYVPPQPPPKPPAQIVEVHWSPPNSAMAYKVIQDFQAHLNDSVVVPFTRGQIIYETTTLDMLMQSGCQFIVPLEGSDQFVCCPSCKHRFPTVASG